MMIYHKFHKIVSYKIHMTFDKKKLHDKKFFRNIIKIGMITYKIPSI